MTDEELAKLDLSKIPISEIDIDRDQIMDKLKKIYKDVVKAKEPVRAIMFSNYLYSYKFYNDLKMEVNK